MSAQQFLRVLLSPRSFGGLRRSSQVVSAVSAGDLGLGTPTSPRLAIHWLPSTWPPPDVATDCRISWSLPGTSDPSQWKLSPLDEIDGLKCVFKLVYLLECQGSYSNNTPLQFISYLQISVASGDGFTPNSANHHLNQWRQAWLMHASR